MNQHTEGATSREVGWDEILGRLDAVLALCRSLDLVEEVAGSRFEHHRERLVAFNDQLKSGGSDAAGHLYETDRLAYLVALTEAGELATLEPFLSKAPREALRPKLRDMLSGSVLPSAEGQNSNHGRNILFELNLAAKLSAIGLTPVLGDRPDLSCEVDGKKLLIECKRPLTERGARTRISKAWKTLVAESKRDGPGTRGVAALSIGKLISNGGHFLRAPNEAAARKTLGELIARKAAWLNDSWSGREAEVIGILFHVITPTFSTNTNKLGIQEQGHWIALAPEGSPDSRIVRGLASRLKAKQD